MIEDALWTIVAIILAIVLLVIYPIYQEYKAQEALIQMHLVQTVDKAVSTITTQGKLDRMTYEQLVSELTSSGYSYDITIERQIRKVYPVYQDATDSSTFDGKLAVVYETIGNKEILNSLYSSENESKTYNFSVGDYIAITVKSKTRSRSDVLAELLWHIKLKKASFYTRIGGMIANET